MCPNTWYLGLTLSCTTCNNCTHPDLPPCCRLSPNPSGGPWVTSTSVSSGMRSHFSRQASPRGRLNPHPPNSGCLVVYEDTYLYCYIQVWDWCHPILSNPISSKLSLFFGHLWGVAWKGLKGEAPAFPNRDQFLEYFQDNWIEGNYPLPTLVAWLYMKTHVGIYTATYMCEN